MRRTVRTIVTILFLGIVLGCGFAILYLGTSTGLTFGGSTTEMAAANKTYPVYAQVGWLRNTAPWPITIQSITTNSAHVRLQTDVYMERAQSGSRATSGATPEWTLSAEKPPYQLDGGSLRYLGFAVTPQANKVASLSSITIRYTGPFGLKFHATFNGTRVAAASSTLPAGILATDPTSDSTSLNTYITLLRTALFNADPAQLAIVMGDSATPADAQVLLKLEKGYKTKDSLIATPDANDKYTQKLTLYLGDPVKGALPPIEVTWAGYRWSVIRSQ